MEYCLVSSVAECKYCFWHFFRFSFYSEEEIWARRVIRCRCVSAEGGGGGDRGGYRGGGGGGDRGGGGEVDRGGGGGRRRSGQEELSGAGVSQQEQERDQVPTRSLWRAVPHTYYHPSIILSHTITHLSHIVAFSTLTLVIIIIIINRCPTHTITHLSSYHILLRFLVLS